eukprot:1176475-Prorocentrum_minimum.AAC.1
MPNSPSLTPNSPSSLCSLARTGLRSPLRWCPGDWPRRYRRYPTRRPRPRTRCTPTRSAPRLRFAWMGTAGRTRRACSALLCSALLCRAMRSEPVVTGLRSRSTTKLRWLRLVPYYYSFLIFYSRCCNLRCVWCAIVPACDDTRRRDLLAQSRVLRPSADGNKLLPPKRGIRFPEYSLDAYT